jgi:biopolymer transport protein ExbD
MINIKGKKDYQIALESVAMTDIVMNMFIFFFISFSLLYTFNQTRLSKIEVRLPKAQSAVSLEGVEKVILTITKRGEYFVNDDKVKAGDLKAIFKAKLKENPSAAFLLKVDNMTKFDNVVKALDVINELNIKQVSIASIKKE